MSDLCRKIFRDAHENGCVLPVINILERNSINRQTVERIVEEHDVECNVLIARMNAELLQRSPDRSSIFEMLEHLKMRQKILKQRFRETFDDSRRNTTT